MAIPFIQQFSIAKFIITQKLKGNKKYPLVLMLEPLFQCNLACAGCGKIEYPKDILKKRLPLEDALNAVDECNAPVISIPGGEPLIHKEMPQLVTELIKRKKFVYLCTNAILLAKKIDEYKPSPYFTWSIHLDGLQEEHDKSVCQDGIFDKAVTAIKLALEKGFRVSVNCTLFDGEIPKRVAEFFDYCTELGVEGITVSPGYSYEFAPQQDVFLPKNKSKDLFRGIFKEGKKANANGDKRNWPLNHSSLYLDFLAGNQTYQCTPWSNVTYNIFGWQKPCYLLVDEGYAGSYKELIEDTEWENYGTGRNPKCDNCMAHCGYEGTAVEDTFKHPIKALMAGIRGPKLDGPYAPELPITYKQTRADNAIPVYVSTEHEAGNEAQAEQQESA